MRINSIRLKSKNLEAQKVFYTQKIGFELLDASAHHFTIKVGATQLSFEASTDDSYYHFAFNIPSFQIQEAFSWLQSRAIDCIPYEDSYFVDFKSWNAEAIYFYDADGNIAELIARKNLSFKMDKPFSIESILNVSEIGMPVADVNQVYNQLSKYPELPQYSGDHSYFCVMGDEEGLLLIVDRATKKWMPTDLPAISVPFKMEMVNNDETYTFEFTGERVEVIKQVEKT